ncbi:MAG: hypothetical protein ACK4EX_01070 [Thermaurantimonas sp.]
MQQTITPSQKKSPNNSKKPKKSTIQRLLNYSKSVVVVESDARKWLINLN